MWFDFGRELDLVLCVLDSLNLLMSCRGQANRSFNQEGDIYMYMSIDKAIYSNPFFYLAPRKCTHSSANRYLSRFDLLLILFGAMEVHALFCEPLFIAICIMLELTPQGMSGTQSTKTQDFNHGGRCQIVVHGTCSRYVSRFGASPNVVFHSVVRSLFCVLVNNVALGALRSGTDKSPYASRYVWSGYNPYYEEA